MALEYRVLVFPAKGKALFETSPNEIGQEAIVKVLNESAAQGWKVISQSTLNDVTSEYDGEEMRFSTKHRLVYTLARELTE